MLDSDHRQTDWVSFADHRAQQRRLLKASVDRLGLARVAGVVGQAPSTISNQLSGLDANKRPSADLHDVCWLLDPTYREHYAGVLGEVLSRPPDLTPEQALRDLAVKAQARGYVAVEDVTALLARTRTAPAADQIPDDPPASLRAVPR